MSVRRILVAATVVVLTAVGVSACGGGDSSAGKGTTSSPTTGVTPSDGGTDQVDPGEPTDTTLQQPKAAETIQPRGTLTAVPGASELPVQGLRVVQGFPVPPGVKVKDPGPLEDTWQFDIRSSDLAGVIAFYKRVLPDMGYTVRTDVTYTLGNENVHWDLVFDGRISGTMVRDPANGVVFVVVNPPGQKAIAGEK